MTPNVKLVLPTRIPWGTLKGKDLEECCYWLLHAMGAQDLHWRLGGVGQGAPDQGRDLEATFYQADPDGELVRQRWWVEAKGRSSTVEKEAVVRSAQHISAFSQVDIALIVTNTQFSNPTLDWAKQWNSRGQKQRIRLWDRHTLERLLCEHPTVVARLFPKAVSPQGQLDFLTSGFWNQSQRGDAASLKVLWGARHKLDWDIKARIAVIASEVYNGNICERAWGATLDDREFATTFATALINTPGLLLRAKASSGRADGYFEFLSYMLLCALSRFKPKIVTILIESAWRNPDGSDFPQEVRDAIMVPVVARLQAEIFDLCLSRCHRITTQPTLLTEQQIENYWDRLRINDSVPPIDPEKGAFTIEICTVPCKVGFRTTKKAGCPYLREADLSLSETLETLHKTIQFRQAQQAKQDSDPLRKLFLRYT